MHWQVWQERYSREIENQNSQNRNNMRPNIVSLGMCERHVCAMNRKRCVRTRAQSVSQAAIPYRLIYSRASGHGAAPLCRLLCRMLAPGSQAFLPVLYTAVPCLECLAHSGHAKDTVDREKKRWLQAQKNPIMLKLYLKFVTTLKS